MITLLILAASTAVATPATDELEGFERRYMLDACWRAVDEYKDSPDTDIRAAMRYLAEHVCAPPPQFRRWKRDACGYLLVPEEQPIGECPLHPRED